MRGLGAASGILITLLGARVAAAQSVPSVAAGASPAALLPLPARAVPPPMWPTEDLPPRAPRVAHRNVGMMIAGIVVTTLGAAVGVTSIGFAANSNSLGLGIVLMPIGGILLPGIGIPLWLSGSRSTYSWDEAGCHPPALPGVAAGPRTAQIGWAF